MFILRRRVNNCTTVWTSRNGVDGRLFTGEGDYADKSIFLPATGWGDGSSRLGVGMYGTYWSSTPDEGNPEYVCAWLLFNSYSSSNLHRSAGYRWNGQSVRPVRDSAE